LHKKYIIVKLFKNKVIDVTEGKNKNSSLFSQLLRSYTALVPLNLLQFHYKEHLT